MPVGTLKRVTPPFAAVAPLWHRIRATGRSEPEPTGTRMRREPLQDGDFVERNGTERNGRLPVRFPLALPCKSL